MHFFQVTLKFFFPSQGEYGSEQELSRAIDLSLRFYRATPISARSISLRAAGGGLCLQKATLWMDAPITQNPISEHKL